MGQVLRSVLRLALCLALLSAAQAEPKKSSPDPATPWTEEQQAILLAIAKVLPSRPPGAPDFCAHFQFEQRLSFKDMKTGKVYATGQPARGEMWLDESRRCYRLEYHPKVERAQGMIPYYGVDSVEICDGSRHYLIGPDTELLCLQSHATESAGSLYVKYFRSFMNLPEPRFLASMVGTFSKVGKKDGPDFKFDVSVEEREGGEFWRIYQKQMPFAINAGSKAPERVTVYEVDAEYPDRIVYFRQESSDPGERPQEWTLLEAGRTSSGDFYPKKFRYTYLYRPKNAAQNSEEHTTETTITSFELLKELPTETFALPECKESAFLAADGKVVLRERLTLELANIQDGKLLSGAKVSVRVNKQPELILLSSDSGLVEIPLPAGEVVDLRIVVTAPGFTPQRAEWIQKDAMHIQLPERFRLALYPSAPISGRVVDESGAAIEGATVRCAFGSGRNWTIFRNVPDLAGADAEVKTDAEGRWMMPRFPYDLTGLRIWIKHPNYGVTSSRPDDFRVLTGRDYFSLRDGTCTITLSEGDERSQLTGKVVDRDGQPVEGCRVSLGKSRTDAEFLSRVTNKEGGFRLHGLKDGKNWITFESPKHMPVVMEVSLPVPEPFIVKLEPGKTLRVRLFKEDGTPSVGLKVEAFVWHGERSLSFQTVTDAEGAFEWNGAPSDEVYFNFGVGQDRECQLEHGLIESSELQIIVLKPTIHLKAYVLDAATGLPIPEIRLSWSNVLSSPEPKWRRDKSFFRNGFVEWKTGYFRYRKVFLLEADGYEPLQTEVFEPNQQVSERTYRLTRKP